LVAIIVIAAVLISKEEPPKPQAVAQPLAAAPNPLPPAATPPPPAAEQPSVQAFLEKAQAQSQQERWEDALETLRAGLLAHDKDAQLEQARDKANMERGSKATFDAAEAAAERGDVGTARELYGQIAESSHYYSRATKRLAELKSIKEPRTAQKASGKQKNKPEAVSKPEPATPPPAATQTPREQSTALVKQANDAVLQNRIKDAIELYQEAAHADPKNPAPHRGLGIAQARAGNGAASIEQYRVYLQLAPTAGDANQVRKIIHDFESGGEE
jgi:tetratricopeptide (TPR) repeat protein